MTLLECLFYCIEQKELVENFNRLNGTSIGVDSRSAIEKSIDGVTGYLEVLAEKRNDEVGQFVNFVIEYIYLPVFWNNQGEVA